MTTTYDVIVVGAGHAGNEAASAAATMGSKTLLITMNINTIGQMSCNPAVGGIAKGQIVREIDALGGQMGIVTDRSAIQFRMLNRGKGPAMWSPRSQSDRKRFIEEWIHTLTNISNLHIWQDCVTSLIIKGKEVVGVRTLLGAEFLSRSVVLTNGTFLNGLMHFGPVKLRGGRIAEPASYGLSDQLASLGFRMARMKTGTPARIDKRTIDFSRLTEQAGDDDFHKFSYLDSVCRDLKQMSCWITYTNPHTHDILRAHLTESPLFNGQIASIGPRYCPSIETKIVTFADKASHQLFLEPEGVDSNEYYVNGFSSSLPMDVQMEALHSIVGLENVVLYRPGYAIEYDFFDPTQLYHTLQTKLLKRLFFAGQINGTTGYEEAAGQGIIAGINAHLTAHDTGDSFALSRNEAYIGVLIDDLVNKGVDEPYRMFTSRAEYRILLRQDNADERLTGKGFSLGLASCERHNLLTIKNQEKERLATVLQSTAISPEDVNGMLEMVGSQPLSHSVKLSELLLRPQVTLSLLIDCSAELREAVASIPRIREEVEESVEIQLKYQGYIERERLSAEKLQRLDKIRLPEDFDYSAVQSLSTEARQKLTRIKPRTIGDAERIPGVSPNDISVLLVLLGR